MIKLRKWLHLSDRFFASRKTRFAANLGVLALLGATMLHGASRSGAFADEESPWSRLPGRLASLVGLAADHIQLTGLAQHEPDEVLAALALKPGKPIIGFDANVARQTLQALPWVKSASVEREYPNMLKIRVVERVAVALWQHDHVLELVDDAGVAMGQPRFLLANHLPLVTGLGANTEAAALINDLSAIPGLSEKVSAAARVGNRRWTLYFADGVKVALPEEGVRQALQTVWNLDQQQAILSKGISMIDMRLPGQMTVQVAEAEVQQDPSAKPAGAKN
ncbi:MAG: FtsQ-type POTRA domain-containing protein [Alphaproteobacteria bacterium]|nr:FtsQ-type POTRA domain-containing protein [Alphaproteobacteria bacterium]